MPPRGSCSEDIQSSSKHFCEFSEPFHFLGSCSHALEKQNIACHISKQRMSQSSAIATTANSELVSPEGTQEGKNTCHLAAIRLQPPAMGGPEETQDFKTQILAPDNGGSYQMNDSSELRLLHLPTYRKELNSLT